MHGNDKTFLYFGFKNDLSFIRYILTLPYKYNEYYISGNTDPVAFVVFMNSIQNKYILSKGSNILSYYIWKKLDIILIIYVLNCYSVDEKNGPKTHTWQLDRKNVLY